MEFPNGEKSNQKKLFSFQKISNALCIYHVNKVFSRLRNKNNSILQEYFQNSSEFFPTGCSLFVQLGISYTTPERQCSIAAANMWATTIDNR